MNYYYWVYWTCLSRKHAYLEDWVCVFQRILIHSHSRVVQQVLKDAAQSNKRFQVFVTESRPNNAGYPLSLMTLTFTCNRIQAQLAGYPLSLMTLTFTCNRIQAQQRRVPTIPYDINTHMYIQAQQCRVPTIPYDINTHMYNDVECFVNTFTEKKYITFLKCSFMLSVESHLMKWYGFLNLNCVNKPFRL